MTSPIRQIELALVQRLRQVSRSYQVPTVEAYDAQLDDELFGWVRQLPAIWVTFDAGAAERTGARSQLVKGTFEVLCGQRSLVQQQGRQAGPEAGAGVGVYQLLEDNKLALWNETLGLRIRPITPGAIRPVMKSMVNREAVTVYAQQFATAWMEQLPEPGATPAGELLTVGLDYLLKPGDEAVDASDRLSLNP